MKKAYMLDTNICSFVMRQRPSHLLELLQTQVENKHRMVISAITYAEMRFGAVGKKASPKHNGIIDQFMQRIDSVLPWDKRAVEVTARVKKDLADKGTPIGVNDTAIAGHAMATDSLLVTNNTREFGPVVGLQIEDWAEVKTDKR